LVQAALDHLLDGGSEVAVLLLEAALVLRQITVEIMEQHPIKGSPLGMSGTIQSRHGGRMASKNGPKTTS
jgi:hypothetical protein